MDSYFNSFEELEQKNEKGFFNFKSWKLQKPDLSYYGRLKENIETGKVIFT